MPPRSLLPAKKLYNLSLQKGGDEIMGLPRVKTHQNIPGENVRGNLPDEAIPRNPCFKAFLQGGGPVQT